MITIKARKPGVVYDIVVYICYLLQLEGVAVTVSPLTFQPALAAILRLVTTFQPYRVYRAVVDPVPTCRGSRSAVTGNCLTEMNTRNAVEAVRQKVLLLIKQLNQF